MGWLLAAIGGLFIWNNTRPASGQRPTRAAYDRMTTNELMKLAMLPSTQNLSALGQMQASMQQKAASGDTLASGYALVINSKFVALQAGQSFNAPMSY